METPQEILQKHHLKSTKLRNAVLNALIASDKGLSNQDFAAAIDFDYDRVTLFRVLNAFEEAGILHKLIDNNGNENYAYNRSTRHHAHFVCNACNRIYCMSGDVNLQYLQIPEGFEIDATDIKVRGLCADCARKNNNTQNKELYAGHR